MEVQLMAREEDDVNMNTSLAHPNRAPWLSRFCGFDTFAVFVKEPTNCGAFVSWIIIPLLMLLFAAGQVWYRYDIVTKTQSATLLVDRCVPATFKCTVVGGCTLSLLAQNGAAWVPQGTQKMTREKNNALFNGGDVAEIGNGDSVNLSLCPGLSEFIDVSPTLPQLVIGAAVQPIRAAPLFVSCPDGTKFSELVESTFQATGNWDKEAFNLTYSVGATQPSSAFVNYAYSMSTNMMSDGVLNALQSASNQLTLFRKCSKDPFVQGETATNLTEFAAQWSLDETRLNIVGAQAAFGSNSLGFFLASWKTVGKDTNMSVLYISVDTDLHTVVDGISSVITTGTNSQYARNVYASALGPPGSGIAFLGVENSGGSTNVYLAHIVRPKGATENTLLLTGELHPLQGNSIALAFDPNSNRLVCAGADFGRQYVHIFSYDATWSSKHVSLKLAWDNNPKYFVGKETSSLSATIVGDTFFLLMPVGVLAVNVHTGSISDLWSPLPLGLNLNGLALSTSFLISPPSAPSFLFAGMRVLDNNLNRYHGRWNSLHF